MNATNSLQTAMITSGNFANGKDQQGNFTGITHLGKQIFISKKLMESLGITKDEEMKQPFYALTGVRKINPRDENGNITVGQEVDREQVVSVFKTQEEMIKAQAFAFEFNLASAEYKLKLTSGSDLSKEIIDQLITADL